MGRIAPMVGDVSSVPRWTSLSAGSPDVRRRFCQSTSEGLQRMPFRSESFLHHNPNHGLATTGNGSGEQRIRHKNGPWVKKLLLLRKRKS